MKSITIKQIVLTALAMTLVFAATFLIKIPNGFQGYVNAGDGVLLAFSVLLSPPLAFFAGAIGSCLADIAGGYASYALFTLIIKGLEAFFVSVLIRKIHKRNVSFLIGCLWMCLGYILADTFVNQSLGIALMALIPNLIQAAVGILIANALIPILSSLNKES